MHRGITHVSRYLRVAAFWMSIAAGFPVLRAQEAPVPPPPIPGTVSVETPEADPVPALFPHPETDRVWISGQANWISQWHPAFHSPYQGVNSLPPEKQDATSRSEEHTSELQSHLNLVCRLL